MLDVLENCPCDITTATKGARPPQAEPQFETQPSLRPRHTMQWLSCTPLQAIVRLNDSDSKDVGHSTGLVTCQIEAPILKSADHTKVWISSARDLSTRFQRRRQQTNSPPEEGSSARARSSRVEPVFFHRNWFMKKKKEKRKRRSAGGAEAAFLKGRQASGVHHVIRCMTGSAPHGVHVTCWLSVNGRCL